MKNFPLLICFVLLSAAVDRTASYTASGPHIADVNVLLPPKMTNPVEYRLQGSDGCFKWSWDHHDILSVLPEYNGTSHCSTSARLRSIAPYSGRKETAVYAADVYTGIVIRCKVFIDNLLKIKIFHSSIKLDLDGLATLRVRAFDGQENVFSSLVGLQFMWNLKPDHNKLPHHLANVPLKDSPLNDCGGFCGDLDIQIGLEDSGVFSDLYAVKGVEIGHEIVSVHLLEPDLKYMADEIVLTVAEAMSLYPPSPLYVLVGAVIPYTLKVIRANTPQVVTLPSPYHRWYASNSTVVEVDSLNGVANALCLGMTNVIVEDTRVADHVQVSSLNVVTPDSLCLYITPMSSAGDLIEGKKSVQSMARWYVISGCQYLIQLKAFAQGPDALEIYISENDDIKFYDERSECWETFLEADIAVKHGWRNSKVLKTYSSGFGELVASLTYSCGRHESREVIKVVQEIMVCDQIKFSLGKEGGDPQSILLPWAPAVYQEVELKAIGGCARTSSDYKWLSSDTSIVSVSAFGVVQAKKPGKATVTVQSVFDPLNNDEVVVEVSTPASMVMLRDFPVETVVGSHLRAAITMKALNGDYFYRCDAFSSFIKWKVGSESFVIVSETSYASLSDSSENTGPHSSSYGPPCSLVHIYASSPGLTMVHATLLKEFNQLDHPSQKSAVLKSSVRIAAYPPLIVSQAADGSPFGGYSFDLAQAEADKKLENMDNLYLVPGTCMDVLLLGGPELWDKSVEFIESVEIFDDEHSPSKNRAWAHQLSGGNRSLYRVFCQSLGTSKIVFRRGNLVADDHPLPAIAEVYLYLVCRIPSSIVLLADEPVNKHDAIRAAIQAERSSGRLRQAPVTVSNGHTVRISAVGISNSGVAFANSSSLYMRWDLSSCDGLAHWDDAYNIMKSSTWEKFMVLKNESGLCIVRATITNFVDDLGNILSGHFPETENVLTDAVRLQLVSTLTVYPHFNLLYFNPEAKLNLSITGGSCFLEVASNNTHVVEVIQPPSSLQCLQLICSPKGLGIALVSVYDIGFTPPITAATVVQVADIDWIKIIHKEISLMEGSLQAIDLLAGVNDGNTFDSSQFVYMNILLHIEDHIIELVDDDGNSNLPGGYINSPSFKIKGRHLGFTTLYVSALQQSGLEIRSQPIKVEVYAPPRIHPHQIFLVPGASYVLTIKGGPLIGVHVEYASVDDKIAKIDKHTGRVSAVSTGNTTISASVFGKEDTVICQAYCSISVGVPSAMVLNVQSGQLGIGHEMPIYPLFSEGNLFSFYELCKSYQWTIEDEKVLAFRMEEGKHGKRNGTPLDTTNENEISNYFEEKEPAFINVLYGRSAGRTNVLVSFSCDFTTSGSKSQPRLYHASLSLVVVPDLPLALGAPITWILPPHYTTRSLLPLSAGPCMQFDSQSHKGTITYSLLRNCGEKNDVLQKDTIFIDSSRIKTTESNNLACIQAKDHTTGRSVIASCVMVAEVSQARITSKEFPAHVIDLGVGDEINLPTSYHDALGNPFYEAYDAVPFYVETNYPDVVLINNTSDRKEDVHIKAIQLGKALIRVSIGNAPEKSDYMLIRVGAHIHPQNPVIHIGSSLNLSIKGLSDNVSGQWRTSNRSVIALDRLSGVAKAVGAGTCQAFFECPSLKLQTNVAVLKGDIVSLDAPREMLTNVPYPTKGYNFSVTFRDNSKAPNKGLSFDCTVNPAFVGFARPWLDQETEKSYCLFFPYSPEHLVHSAPKMEAIRPDISLSIKVSMKEAPHISGSAPALFIGGFSILEMDKNLLQLNLTPDSNKTSITILGNTDVEIYWHIRDSLLISLIHKEGYGIGGRALYEVKVLQAGKFRDKIIITLPANGQRVELDVNYNDVDGASSEATTSATLWATVLGCLVLFICTVAVFVWYLDKPSRPQQSNVPTAPSLSAPLTPPRSSPAILDELSPRTPQPFVDYVRRTIDETPYYRREGRRMNAQNTF